ncbi:hypothetical protein Ancab_003489 [Ancistrocladus abbreviatus]
MMKESSVCHEELWHCCRGYLVQCFNGSTPSIGLKLHKVGMEADSYGKHPPLLGIELLNEPSASAVPLDVLLSYLSSMLLLTEKAGSICQSPYRIVCQRRSHGAVSGRYWVHK